MQWAFGNYLFDLLVGGGLALEGNAKLGGAATSWVDLYGHGAKQLQIVTGSRCGTAH